MRVYLVIDDYTPDAGSTIYGVFETDELAEAYIATGIREEYGDDRADNNNAYVQSYKVWGKV